MIAYSIVSFSFIHCLLLLHVIQVRSFMSPDVSQSKFLRSLVGSKSIRFQNQVKAYIRVSTCCKFSESNEEDLVRNAYTPSRLNIPDKSFEDIWSVRRRIIRSLMSPSIKKNIEDTSKNINSTNESNFQSSLAISSFFIAVLAIVFRFGGRIAIMKLLGLDMLIPSSGNGDGVGLDGIDNSNDLNKQINDFVTYFQSLGVYRYGGFFASWLIAKAFCIDAFTIVLAFSAGILFDGLWQGTLASVVCSSTASLLVFFFSRYALRDWAKAEIAKRSTFRAVDRACAKEGFKTVFTLRVSPILPIPIGVYNYIYGASSVSAVNFISGISLGSIKPYLFDCYLGLFGKSVLDQQSSTEQDIILAVFMGLVILVGTYASQLASQTWIEIQKEADIEIDPNDLSNSSNNNSTSFLSSWGINENVVPKFVLDFQNDIGQASDRVQRVITSESNAVEKELKNGVEIGWDVEKDFKFNQTRNIERSFRSNYQYPGCRELFDFETVSLDKSSMMRYTYESMVFSFILGAEMFKDRSLKTKSKAVADSNVQKNEYSK